MPYIVAFEISWIKVTRTTFQSYLFGKTTGLLGNLILNSTKRRSTVFTQTNMHIKLGVNVILEVNTSVF